MAIPKIHVNTSKKRFFSSLGLKMFLWVTLASVICSVSVVFSIIMIQRILFVNKVIDEKGKSLKVLTVNNTAISNLRTEIQNLNYDENLISSKAQQTDQAIQVILDALPVEANYPALGSSLQRVLLINSQGVQVNSFSVSQLSSTVGVASSKIPGAYEMAFSFSAVGSSSSMVEFLKRLEKSIRVVDSVSYNISGASADRVSLVFNGVVYYQPVKTLKITEKEVK